MCPPETDEQGVLALPVDAGHILLLVEAQIAAATVEAVVVTVHDVMATVMTTVSAVPAGSTTKTAAGTDRHPVGAPP
jgi:hypothetical protein